MSAKIVGYTVPQVEGVATIMEFVAYMAKVSSNSQENLDNSEKLIRYLIDHNHWSPFEMVNVAIEIEAPRDISRQMLRHATAKFQEFSQRYAKVKKFTIRELRSQDTKNRQNSIDDFSEVDKQAFRNDCHLAIDFARSMYDKWLERGAAKECARVFLPEGLTMSRMYMNAPLRTWYHYLAVREGNGTQLEHSLIANEIRAELHSLIPEMF